MGRRPPEVGGCPRAKADGVLLAKPQVPDTGFRPEEESRILRAEPGTKEYLGNGRLPEHFSGRQRSRYRRDANRAPAADRGSDSQGRPSAVVHSRGFFARSRKGALPVWGITVGRSRRYVPRRVRVLGSGGFPGILCRQSRQRQARISDAIWDLRAELRAG